MNYQKTAEELSNRMLRAMSRDSVLVNAESAFDFLKVEGLCDGLDTSHAQACWAMGNAKDRHAEGERL